MYDMEMIHELLMRELSGVISRDDKNFLEEVIKNDEKMQSLLLEMKEIYAKSAEENSLLREVLNSDEKTQAQFFKMAGIQAISTEQLIKFWKLEDEKDSESQSETFKLIIDDTPKIKRIIANIISDSSMLVKIGSYEFEQLILELLLAQGFKGELTPRTRDGGFDIILWQKVLNHADLKWLVECKRYSEQRKVGVEVVRGFQSVIHTNNANRGIIVTTSSFSNDALNFKNAHAPHLIDFRDRNEVMKWISQYWESKLKR